MHTFIQTMFAAAVLVLPSTVFAQTIDVQDSIAGLPVAIVISQLGAETGYDVVVQPPIGPELVLSEQSTVRGTVQTQLQSDDTTVAGLYTVSLEQSGTVIGNSANFIVEADAPSDRTSSIDADRRNLDPNGTDQAIVTVIVRDQYSNTLEGRPITLISSRSTDTITAVTNETDATGAQTFMVSSVQRGTMILRALDLLTGTVIQDELVIKVGQDTPQQSNQGIANNGQGYYPYPIYPYPYGFPYGANLLGQVASFDVISGFSIQAPSSVNANEEVSITITAIDTNRNTVEDYTGVVLFESSDTKAKLPLDNRTEFYDFNLGVKPLTQGIIFKTPGTHTLTVTDSNDSSLTGTVTIEVQGRVQQTNQRTIRITSPVEDTLLSDSRVVVSGTGPELINMTVYELLEDGTEQILVDSAGTDVEGAFSIAVDLDTSTTEHTLQIRDDFGGNESATFTVRFDVTPPEITDIRFNPEIPIEGERVTIEVTADDTATISIRLNDEVYTPEKISSGVYQQIFNAPLPGDYNVIVSAEDSAGNIFEQTAVLSVDVPPPPPLPEVTNVRTSPGKGEITLEWDPIVDIEFDAYAIYVGTSPDDFPNRLLGDKRIPNAIIGELDRAKTYYFYVTAQRGEEESEEYEIANETTLGLRLNVTPDDGVLKLDWSNVQTGEDLVIGNFYLDYGIEEENYSERRILNGSIRDFEVQDLLNDVAYFLRLTPLDQAGRPIEDFIVYGDGIPYSVLPGFRASASETPPFNYIEEVLNPAAPPPIKQVEVEEIPVTTETGSRLPLQWIALALLVFVSLLYWRHRRQRTISNKFSHFIKEHYNQV